MANLAPDMPSEGLVGVTTPASVQTSNNGGASSVPTANNNNSTTGIASTQTSESDNINLNPTSSNNNTISAAADSSDNQPSPQQAHHTNSNDTTTQHSSSNHHPYVNHNIYGHSQQPSTATLNPNPVLNQLYTQHYAQPNVDLHHQHQQLHHQQQNIGYPSFLNSYEQFYQQQQQSSTEGSTQNQHNAQQMDFINSNMLIPVRYHPYLNRPTSNLAAVNLHNNNSNNALDSSSQAAPVVSAASSSVMSPRVVSSTSPTSSNQMQISGSTSSIGSMSVGNPSSPNSAGSLQCKKCGVMCANDPELQEHITNVHGASPYGSSGYASSPYIKEEMQQQTPPQNQQQQQAQQPPAAHQTSSAQGNVNPGEILDLDSQKLLYPPAGGGGGGGSMPAMMHANLGNNSANPLHDLHNMQQRAGINTWDQQSQEGQPPYMVANSDTKSISSDHASFYQSPKQSPYHITNTSNIIKTEYQPIVKCEYNSDTQQYLDDKSFDPTAPSQQQQMMPPVVSSSPAEFPSTTTGGPQDNPQQNVVSNQQFRGGNFEPPSSSSANITSGPLGTKAANWKSNEARRPKTYNCTACNKWFTSSGHLKRHYNTTLHKNAVKSSGQPDPANMPASAHHHPARDPTVKTGRGRGASAAAAAAAAAHNNAQQQQQPPNPVQPPEPPNSPQGYGGSQVAATGLTPLSHYTNTPSPNTIFENHQYTQQQYVGQVQSTTNASPQHANSMSNQHLLQNPQQPQQQTVLNGHPNALAGLSVPVYQHQMPMPSSQMRGLLNNTTTMPLSTATNTLHITKIEHLEAALIQSQYQAHEKEASATERGYLSKVQVKQEFMEEQEETDHQHYQEHNIMCYPKFEEVETQRNILIYQLQSTQVLREVGHHHQPNATTQQIPLYQPEHMQTFSLNQTTHNNMHTNNSNNNTPILKSLPTICHQLYPAQQQQDQTVQPDIYTATQPTLPPQYNTTVQHYINTQPLAINSMQQLQPQYTIMEQQRLPPATTIRTTNMASIQQASHQHMQQQQLQPMEQQPLANMPLQLDIISTNTPLHTITTTTSNMPSYHQVQQPVLGEPQPQHIPISPPIIIGSSSSSSSENANINLFASSEENLNQTTDGQLTAGSALAPKTAATQSFRDHLNFVQKSPTAGDLPPLALYYQQNTSMTYKPVTTPPISAAASSSIYQDLTDSTKVEFKSEYLDNHLAEATSSETPTTNELSNDSPAKPNARARKATTSKNEDLTKCLLCDKDFAKSCYLTQHNNSLHSGEYPFRCEKCGKRFQIDTVYYKHLEKHATTDKAHKCQYCPKQFHHKTDLRRHIESLHTGIKPHICDICGKDFSRRDHLRKHIETHNRPRVAAPARKKNQATTTGAGRKTKTAKVYPTKRTVAASILNTITENQSNGFNKTIILASDLSDFCNKLKNACK